MVDPDNVFLLGESQGGFVCSYFAATYPDEIRGLIPFYPAFIRIRVCIDRHLVLWKEALDQGVDIIQKILPVQLNSDIQRANPSMILSSLMVVVLPWPGRTCTSSGSVVRSVVSDSRRSRTEPVGRSYLP